MGMICSRTVKGAQVTDEAPMKTGAAAFKVKTGDALFNGDGATKTGAAPWISRWWYLLQLFMSYRFFHEQSCDWWSADSKQKKHNLFCLPN